MLIFDPENRITLKECLNLKVFQDIRDKQFEIDPDFKIDLPSEEFESKYDAVVFMINEIKHIQDNRGQDV